MRPVTTRLRFVSAALAAALGCSLQHPAVDTDVPRDLDDVSSDPTTRPDADVPVADDVLDVPVAPDADVPVAPDADVPVDEPVAPDADVPVTLDADVPVAPDADVPVAPDADVPVAPDADVPVAPDADVPVTFDADVPVAPDADVPVTRDADVPTPDACADPSCAIQSCADLPPRSASGVYTLRALGAGTWRGYCDVPTDGSPAWTLVMKVDGARTTFQYDSMYWTTSSLYNPGTVDLSQVEAKYEGYNATPVRELRLVTLSDGIGQRDVIITTVPTPTAAPALGSIVLGRVMPPTLITGASGWGTAFPGATLQNTCTRFGFSVRPHSGPTSARVRIGGVGDNDASCNSPDSWVGVGGFVDNNACVPMGNTRSAGNVSGCDGAATSRRVAAFVWVWVR